MTRHPKPNAGNRETSHVATCGDQPGMFAGRAGRKRGFVENITIPHADDSELTESKPQTDTVSETVPAVVVPSKRGQRKPQTGKPAGSVPRVRKPADTLDVSARFRALFPSVKTVPSWAVPMADVFRTVHANVKPENRTSYDAVLSVASRIIKRPDDGTHAYTFGGVSDVAKTQNCIYVALAIAGIPKSEIPTEYGVALWTAVIGPAGPKTHRCEYRDHVAYFDSTCTRLESNDHNLTPGIPGELVAAVVTAWRYPGKPVKPAKP